MSTGSTSVEDPFFTVKKDVEKNLDSAKKLFERWSILMSQHATLSANPVGRQELDYTSGELQNSLRNIEWDLEDLEETIGIVEKNPRKFRLEESEVSNRRDFVDQTRQKVHDIKTKVDKVTSSTPKVEPAAVLYTAPGNAHSHNQPPRPHADPIEETHAQQQLLLRQQDQTLERLGSGVGVLKDISQRIGTELDDQAVILDEFGREMETTESKLDNTMKKMARVLHMSNDKRQWTVIVVLVIILVILLVLLFLL